MRATHRGGTRWAALFASGALLLGGCQGGEPPPTPGQAPPDTPAFGSPPPATSATPTGAGAGRLDGPTASPSSVLGSPASGAGGLPQGLEWQLVSDFPIDEALEVTAATARADGFVAVGYEPAPGDESAVVRNGVVWTSTDGLSWARTEPPELANATLEEVVALDGRLYLFGVVSVCPLLGEGCVDLPDAGVAVWSSADAAAWERLPVPSSLQSSLFDGAAVGLGRLIAFGSSGEEYTPAVWLSSDGMTWEERHDLAGLDPIGSLAAGPERIVAFGTRYDGASDAVHPVAAYSDGGGFVPASLPPEADGLFRGATWGSAGFVAVGFTDDPEAEGLNAAVLTSPDGAAWTTVDPAGLPTGTGLLEVLPLAEGYVALGYTPDDSLFGRQRAHYTLSAEGRSWSPPAALGGMPYRELTATTIGRPGIVAFSLDFEEEADEESELTETTVQLWFAPLDAGD